MKGCDCLAAGVRLSCVFLDYFPPVLNYLYLFYDVGLGPFQDASFYSKGKKKPFKFYLTS